MYSIKIGKSLEQYDDAILNCLDLMSFMLIAPEITEYAKSTVFEALSIISLVSIAGVLAFIILFIFSIPIISFRPHVIVMPITPSGIIIPSYIKFVLTTFIMLIIAPMLLTVLYVIYAKETVDTFLQNISQHVFAIGAILFLLTRILGVYFGVAKARKEPNSP